MRKLSPSCRVLMTATGCSDLLHALATVPAGLVPVQSGAEAVQVPDRGGACRRFDPWWLTAGVIGAPLPVPMCLGACTGSLYLSVGRWHWMWGPAMKDTGAALSCAWLRLLTSHLSWGPGVPSTSMLSGPTSFKSASSRVSEALSFLR